MRCKRVAWITCLAFSTLFSVLTVCCASTEQECEAAHRELEGSREKLSHYLAALREAHIRGDLRLMVLFNRQIAILIEEMITTEEMIECPEPEMGFQANGLSSTKAVENGSLERSCRELERMHVQLIIRLNSLQRRKHSIFSQLSPFGTERP